MANNMMDSSIPVESLAAPYKERRDLLSFIKEVHRRRGCLTHEDIDRIAAAWGTTPGDVYGVATFYTFLGVKPLGRNVVKVCKSTPCCMKHCDVVVAEVQKALGVKNGETTPDGRFTLMLTNCIGACDNAPAMLINDDLYQGVTPAGIRGILQKYSENGTTGPGKGK